MLKTLNPAMGSIHRIVVTGGPLGSKSTVLKHVENIYKDRSRVMGEVVTMLMGAGYPQPGRDVEFTEEWLEYMNRAIIPTQANMENGHLHAAVVNRMRAVFFDRGILDCAAYVPGGKETLEDQYGLDLEEVYKRYTMVIHMQSLACISPARYDALKHTNPSRYDTAAQAIERDAALIEAWSDHPNWHFLSAEGGSEAVLQRVIDLISPIMDREIERKWVLPAMPLIPKEERYLACNLSQSYLYDGPNAEVRVRSTDAKNFELCIKDKAAMSRVEWEVPIPYEVYRLIVQEPVKLIAKTRFKVPHGEYMLEIDDDKEIITVEVEFRTDQEAREYLLPEWIGPAKEVTGNPLYSNASRAKLPD